MYNKLYRIPDKCSHYVNLFIGKIYDLLQLKNIIAGFPFQVVSNVGTAIRIVHPYPANYREKDKPLFNEWKEYDTFPLDLYQVNNVRVTQEGIVLKNHSTFIKALPHPVFRNKFGVLYNFFTRRFYKKLIAKPGNYLLIYDHWSKNNYFHWTLDCLSRLLIFKQHFNYEFTLLLPENCPGYILESAKKFDIKNIAFIPERSFFQLEKLYIMNYAAWSGQQHPLIIRHLRDFLISNSDLSKSTAGKRIYVSRGKQRSRTIVNEQEVKDLLAKYGFSVVYFEGLSQNEQISIMQQAEYFISSHGANMTNLMFLPAHAKILELINEKKPNFCFWSLASCLGLNYNYQLCKIAASDHVRVDLNELEKNIISLLK